jgi:hypothetical protein
MKYIVDPDAEPDVELLTDALSILKAIRRFWTSVEAGMGTFDDFPGVDLDEVLLGSMIVLQLCLDAYVEGLAAPEGG